MFLLTVLFKNISPSMTFSVYSQFTFYEKDWGPFYSWMSDVDRYKKKQLMKLTGKLSAFYNNFIEKQPTNMMSVDHIQSRNTTWWPQVSVRRLKVTYRTCKWNNQLITQSRYFALNRNMTQLKVESSL